MNKEALAQILFREQYKINCNDTLSTKDKVFSLYKAVLRTIDLLTQEEQLHFTTIFAKIAYVGHKYSLSPHLQYFIHQLRLEIKQIRNEQLVQNKHLDLGNKVLANLVSTVFQAPLPEFISPFIPNNYPIPYQKIEVREFQSKVRVIILSDDPAQNILLGKRADQPSQIIRIHYGQGNRNESFNPTMWNIQKWLSYPITMNLLDAEIDAKGDYYPAAFVLEPDYLVDVSAIAACFNGQTTEVSRYFFTKTTTINHQHSPRIRKYQQFFSG